MAGKKPNEAKDNSEASGGGKVLVFDGLPKGSHTRYTRATDGEDNQTTLPKGTRRLCHARGPCKKGQSIYAAPGHRVAAAEVVNPDQYVARGVASYTE